MIPGIIRYNIEESEIYFHMLTEVSDMPKTDREIRGDIMAGFKNNMVMKKFVKFCGTKGVFTKQVST